MLVLKIIGILLAVIVLLIVFLLMLSVKVVFTFTTEGKLVIKVKVLFFTIYDANKTKDKKEHNKEKKSKKPSRISAYFQRLFGIDTLTEAANVKKNAETKGVYDSVNKVATVFSLLLGQIAWLLGKIRIKRFHILAICGGGDAADAAMEYGLVCAAVYPLVGYVETNLNTKRNASDIQIGCDFENEAYFKTDIIAKLRLIHIVRAVLRNASNMARQQTSEA